MTLDELIAALGYKGSPHFLQRGDGRFESQPGYGHIFRRGEDKSGDVKRWMVEGVYGLRDPDSTPERFAPIVYVCKANDDRAAHELHRLVWNQDVVPYVLVHDPKGVRVYAGFHYNEKGKTDSQRGVLQALTDFDRVQSIVNFFKAKAIDEGTIWQNEHLQVDPSRRVYHQLLKDLRELDKWLREVGRLKKEVSHALIGKYVYLHYLRDRGILSDDRLTTMWGIHESEIFRATATKAALEKLTNHLDDWLNGEIFPLSLNGPNAPTGEHVKRVAAVFAGDEISDKGWQSHLNFKAYDFSYIPIETLSLIYEQFLHAEDDTDKKAKNKKTKGRSAGAYYTPLPLVNFMLAELQTRSPLKEGMKVCDPSCGSGAFLVQAYRRLIETTYPTSSFSRPKPSDLRRLLQTSIFGVDLDGDACQVTQLSLLLTLLDYVNPPDLTGKNSNFKLPSLLNPKAPDKPNLFEGNFFQVESQLRAVAGDGFDWIAGNPPWKQLKKSKHEGHDQTVWDWMETNAMNSPVGMYQMAQAFAWEAPRYLAKDGECGLLVPAMGLVDETSEEFRKKFFDRFRVHGIANFANLAEVLFDGRSRVPAAALFYCLPPDSRTADSDESIITYSPFVANQEATRPPVGRVSLEELDDTQARRLKRRKLWSLTVNSSEIRELDQGEFADGSGLPLKFAMWGTPWDERLIRRLEKKWDSFGELEDNQLLSISEGPQLSTNAKRNYEGQENEEDDTDEIVSLEEAAAKNYQRMDELVGKPVLNVNMLKRLRHIFAIPKNALEKNARRYVCLIHGKGGLNVCEPPHVILGASRNFAIYSDAYIIVPKTQLGITSPSCDKIFLKALALFLSSEFAFYHQFFRSPQMGLKRPVATLNALRQLPIPLGKLPREELAEWSKLHAELSKCEPSLLRPQASVNVQKEMFEDGQNQIEPLLKQANDLVYHALGLDERERALVRDFVQVRFALDDGQQGIEAVRAVKETELRSYCLRLKQELDDFVGDDSDRMHRVTVVHDNDSAMVEVNFTRDREAARKVEILRANSEEAKRLRTKRKELLKERAQWVYFNRNLRIYRGRQTYLFKPLQRFHWTESTAMMDAIDLIAETLGDG
ncbi:MAG TPA: N-6 DNA methylase [Verrucomicrobiae bacterium]|jgi:hypothetical protein|nr:N-6 DNA methylase [Verrucomicrobiae bacterium]